MRLEWNPSTGSLLQKVMMPPLIKTPNKRSHINIGKVPPRFSLGFNIMKMSLIYIPTVGGPVARVARMTHFKENVNIKGGREGQREGERYPSESMFPGYFYACVYRSHTVLGVHKRHVLLVCEKRMYAHVML